MDGWILAESVERANCRVVESCARVTDGDANELDSSQISAEAKKKGAVFIGLGGELLVAVKVLARADLE